jgi:hypothetical protein
MVWLRPAAARTSLREGMRATTEQVVIEGFAELQGSSRETSFMALAGEQGAGARAIGAASVEGNITRWAVVPSGGTWLQAGTSWAWNTTGLRPAGLPRGEKLEAFMGKLSILPATTEGERGWLTLATLSGVGGIDAIVAAAAGDEFTGTFAAGR